MIATYIYNAYELKELIDFKFKQIGFKDFDIDELYVNFLFNGLERLSDDTGEPMIIDAYKLYNDTTISSFEEIRENYEDCKNLSNEEIIDYLNDYTYIFDYDNEFIVYNDF